LGDRRDASGCGGVTQRIYEESNHREPCNCDERALSRVGESRGNSHEDQGECQVQQRFVKLSWMNRAGLALILDTPR
jgi:hypothetical protein